MTIAQFQQQWFDSSDSVDAHTSGSTGAPKPVRLPKADMEASARATLKRLGIDAANTPVFVCPLSAEYIAAKMMAVRAWISNGQLVMIEPSSTHYLEKLPKGAIDLLAIVPAQVPALLASHINPAKLRNIIIGGAALPSKLRRQLAARGFNAYETYGMTETCSHVALRHVPDNGDAFTAVSPEVTFETDQRGCLIVNARHLSVGSVVTNDVVRLLSPSQFEWLGRYDNVINSGAVKVHPEEVERLIIDTLRPEFEFYVKGEPDERWGTAVVLVAAVEPTQGARFLADVRAIIPHKMAPKKIHSVGRNGIRHTPNGKIIRN